MQIVDLGAREPAKRRGPQDRDWTWSKDEAERHSQRLYEQKAKERAELAQAVGLTQFPVPPQATGESGPDYVGRLVQFCAETNRTAEADMARLARERRKMGRYPDRPPEPPATVPEVPIEPSTEEST
jgi:hypothetical protein